MPSKEINYLDLPEYSIDFFDWNPELRFNLKEACQLLNHEVIRSQDVDFLPSPPQEKIGIIVGVLTMNEEIEVILKFDGIIEQLIKAELCGDYIVLND